MGASNSVINVANTTIDLNEYACSDRGLILPSKHLRPTSSFATGTSIGITLVFVFVVNVYLLK